MSESRGKASWVTIIVSAVIGAGSFTYLGWVINDRVNENQIDHYKTLWEDCKQQRYLECQSADISREGGGSSATPQSIARYEVEFSLGQTVPIPHSGATIFLKDISTQDGVLTAEIEVGLNGSKTVVQIAEGDSRRTGSITITGLEISATKARFSVAVRAV